MNTVVLSNGFLRRKFKHHGFPVWDRTRFEIDVEGVLRYDDGLLDFDVIVNCVGKSDTRWCERSDNWIETRLVNGELPGLLSGLFRWRGRKFIHVSTGCLYDRNDVPQSKSGFIVSHCRYTMSKWLGDNALDPEQDLILRPRLFFNDEADAKNLRYKMRRFPAYSDEPNSYTHTAEVVAATRALLESGCSGVFNVACNGHMTIHELAHLVGLDGPKIDAATLRRREGLYLVHSTLDPSRLKRYYTPRNLHEAMMSAQHGLDRRLLGRSHASAAG